MASSFWDPEWRNSPSLGCALMTRAKEEGWNHTKKQVIYLYRLLLLFIAIQPLTHVWLFATPWTAAPQASLSFTISWSLLKLMSIELVMPLNHFILCCPLLFLPSIFPSIRVFFNERAFTSGSQNNGASASASVLPMIIQGWFPLGLISLISLCPRDSQESSPTPQFKSINSSVLCI